MQTHQQNNINHEYIRIGKLILMALGIQQQREYSEYEMSYTEHLFYFTLFNQ